MSSFQPPPDLTQSLVSAQAARPRAPTHPTAFRGAAEDAGGGGRQGAAQREPAAPGAAGERAAPEPQKDETRPRRRSEGAGLAMGAKSVGNERVPLGRPGGPLKGNSEWAQKDSETASTSRDVREVSEGINPGGDSPETRGPLKGKALRRR